MKTKAETMHTPTPWRVANESGIRGPENQPVAGGLFPPDAAFIVKAVNAYEPLIRLLKACRRSGMVETDIPESLYIELEAIAKAEKLDGDLTSSK